ncbi:SIMPL domain-containing protein [Thiomicrorhabdus sp. zzn3]|uniref:SIMPL domain-containing protein n=1 Tax=Thiomicrorhabdus sp. zzn3 TaxID=3039775 RepID=UPI002436AFD8|nr:SIMPL domain-containing protein [Thiomicrorhabdus sp. zzn3]MDG6779164.1 SIMPL domain-containing protein [Thiomicrorhabdus sp. zzn3]
MKTTTHFRPNLFYSLLALLLISFSAHASPQPEEADTDEHRVHFSISNSQKVANNTADITLQAIAQGPNAQSVMQQINQQMQAAIKSLRLNDEVVTQTSSYQVYPVHNKQRIITHWKGQQSLTLTTQNLPGLPTLLENVEPHLSYQSLHFRVSDARQQQVRQQLISKALQHYQQQAKRIAESFATSQYRFVDTRIHFGANNIPRQPMLARSYAETASAPPVMEGGESTITVVVEGELALPTPP